MLTVRTCKLHTANTQGQDRAWLSSTVRQQLYHCVTIATPSCDAFNSMLTIMDLYKLISH